MSWEDKFLQKSDENNLPEEFESVLKAFVSYIEKGYSQIGVTVVNSQVPFHKIVVFQAKYIRSSQTTLCILKRDDVGVSCLPGHNMLGRTEWYQAKDPDHFFLFLKTLSDSDFFKIQAKVMTELNLKDSFEGYVHTKEFYLVDPNDIRIRINRNAVEVIAKSSGDEFEIEALDIKDGYPPTAGYMESNKSKYIFMEINGFKVRVKEVSKVNDVLRIKGFLI
jgi:hypothetical protein